MWSWLVARASRVCPDVFVLSLVGVVLAATLAPCRGISAAMCHGLGIAAIASLFFLQGARLSRAAILDGIMCWRLHLTVATTTFVLFPLTGLALSAVFPTALPPLLWTGVLFLCVLPSTVQSSIALTSMANGNVAGAICSATASNVTGIVLTPLIFSVLSRVHGGGFSPGGVGQVFCELLVPFIAGHWLRPRIGRWVESNRRILSFTDRGSILLVVYGAFSAAVVHGVWQRLPPSVLLSLTLIAVFILIVVLLGITVASVALGIGKQDTIAATFCGSQKSLVSGVPMASALFSAAAIGPVLIPIMIYYPMQLVACAWLARRYAVAPDADLAVIPIQRIPLMRAAACRSRHDVQPLTAGHAVGMEGYGRHDIELRKAETPSLKTERVSIDAELFWDPLAPGRNRCLRNVNDDRTTIYSPDR